MSAPLPVTILGGYLGSGKTTLVNSLLRQADGMRLAVLVNEFGALPIDGELIESRDGNVISIAGGCICCAYGEDLTTALDDIAKLSPAPDHVLVEASGVAIPGAIASALSLRRNISLTGIVVLADAETIEARASDRYVGDTIMRQLEGADLVVLTKLDLVSAQDAKRTHAWLQRSLDRRPVLEAINGQIRLELLMNAPRQWLARISGHTHGAQFETFVLTPSDGKSAAHLARYLAEDAAGVIRAKGFLVDEAGNTVLIQCVGRRWSIEPADPANEPGIVCIGLQNRLRHDETEKSIAALPTRQK